MTYQFRSLADCGAVSPPHRNLAAKASPLKLTHSGIPDGIRPLEITDMLQSLRGQLKLRDQDIGYLRFMMKKLRRDDFAPGRICAVWESVTSISDSLGCSPRQINRIEARLQNAGLIRKTTSNKGNRFGRRDANGHIERAAGINFAPLIERLPEVIDYHRAAKIAADQLKTSRRTAADLITEIRSLEVREALEAARAALPRLRPSEVKCLQKLDTIIEALESVLADFSDVSSRRIEVAQQVSLVRPYTKTNNKTKTCTTAKTEKSARRDVRTTPAQVRLLATAEFAEIMAMYLDGLTLGEPLSWRVIGAAARDFAQMNGISGADWVNCCHQLGEERASLCLLLADRNAQRLDEYRVRDVASAFIGMVRAEARGKAIVEALLAELS